MLPPGKNSGETTNESVVSARLAPPASSRAASSMGSSSGLRNASRNTASTRVRLAFPPAPCDIVIRGSLTRGRLRRARSMRSSTCSSRTVPGAGCGAPGLRSSRGCGCRAGAGVPLTALLLGLLLVLAQRGVDPAGRGHDRVTSFTRWRLRRPKL